MFFHQRHHQQRHRAGRGADHAGPAADDSGNDGNAKRGVKAHFRVNTGYDGKSNCLGDEGKSNNKARQNVAANVSQPVLFF